MEAIRRTTPAILKADICSFKNNTPYTVGKIMPPNIRNAVKTASFPYVTAFSPHRV